MSYNTGAVNGTSATTAVTQQQRAGNNYSAAAAVLDTPTTDTDAHENATVMASQAPSKSVLREIGEGICDGFKWVWKKLVTDIGEEYSKVKAEGGSPAKAIGKALLLGLARWLTAAAIIGAVACPIAGATLGAIYLGAIAASYGVELVGVGVGLAYGALAGFISNLILGAVAKGVGHLHSQKEGQSVPLEEIAVATYCVTAPLVFAGDIVYGVGVIAAGISVLKGKK